MPADSAPATSTSNVWSWLTTLSPAIVALVTGIAGGYLLAPKVNPLPLGAADVPKTQGRLPTPTACAEDFHELQELAARLAIQVASIGADVAELKATAAANWPRPASKLKAAKLKAAGQ